MDYAISLAYLLTELIVKFALNIVSFFFFVYFSKSLTNCAQNSPISSLTKFKKPFLSDC